MEELENELESLNKNQVWKLVDRSSVISENRKPNIIDSRWVLKRKIESDSIRYKARLVIRGFKDCNEYELQETYASVFRLPLIRTILAIANKCDFHICQMDIKTAFLNGQFQSEVYMEIPEGIECSNEVRKRKVCKLEKALYGLKVSSKCWNEKFKETATKMGLTSDPDEHCLFSWNENHKV